MSIPGNSNEKTMESLAEMFRCFICMEKLQDAHMCPHCSKLCCYSCINRWLITETRSLCPHCRTFLDIQDVVNCRWVEEVTQQLDYIEENLLGKKHNLVSSNRGSTDNVEKCTTHQREELSVYCISCNCCICYECALWSSTHAGHTFKPLDDVYNVHCEQVKEQVIHVRNKYMELVSSVQEIQQNMDSMQAAKEQRVRDINNIVELMVTRLDSHLEAKMTTLIRTKNHLVRKSGDIDNLLREINVQFSSGRKSEFILKQSSKFVKSIQELMNQSSFSLTPVLPDFQCELIPNYDSSYFTVNNFSQARSKADAFYSEPLLVNGSSWRLKVYPDGNGIVRGTYLSVFLELTSGPSEPAKYEYRIELIYQGQGSSASNSEKNMMREFASDYEVGECWGYNRYFRLNLLEPEGYLDTANDRLKLKFEVRPSTYYQKCKDQQWYISHLLNSEVQQSAKIQELKDRLQLYDEDAVPESAHADESNPANDQESRDKRTEELFAAYESRRVLPYEFQSGFGEIELEVGNEGDDNSDNESDINSIEQPTPTPSEENDVDGEVAAAHVRSNQQPPNSPDFISELALTNMGFTENYDQDDDTKMMTASSSPNLVDELQFLFLPESPLYSVEQITETIPSGSNTLSDTNDPESEANGAAIRVQSCDISPE